MKTIFSVTIKPIFSMMIALLLVSALTLPSLAGEQKGKPGGGQSNYKPDKPDQPDPEPGDPNMYIKVDCKAVLQGVQYGKAMNEASNWYYHGTLINKTGQVIPKGAKIEYSFSSSKPGYFQTNTGGVAV